MVEGHSLSELCVPSLQGPEGDVGRRMVLVVTSALEPRMGCSGEPNVALAPINLPTAPLVLLPMSAAALCHVFYMHPLNPGGWIFLATFYRGCNGKTYYRQACASVRDTAESGPF